MTSVFTKPDPFKYVTAGCEISLSAFDAAIEEFNNGNFKIDSEMEEDA